jgi:hypothetical protein
MASPRTESLPCGCRVGYNSAGSRVGLSAQCAEATAIFARHAGQPETREVSAARTADFDAHFAAQRAARGGQP